MSLRWREPQALARVRVIRADAHPSELGERNLLGRVVEQHDLQRIAGILRLDQLRQRQGDALGWREAILPVQNHAVAAVEHQHRRARALVLALDDHQVVVRHADPAGVGARDRRRAALGALPRFAVDRVQQRAGGIQVQRVAELVRLGGSRRLDAGRLFTRIVPAIAALAERPEQVAQRAVPEEIERLVGHLEGHVLSVPAGAAAPLPALALASRFGGIVM